MKKILSYNYALFAFGLLFLFSCKKAAVDAVITTITAPVITAPANNTMINLDPESNAVIEFEWEASKTGNFSLPFYKVIFDKENGDFSKPVYTGIPAKVGIENKLYLPHKEVNKAAYAAGIPELGLGKLKWKIIADNGVVSASSGEGMFQIKRPAGFAENPLQLYITGSATEGGADLMKALPFKRLGDGVFEIYTSLNAGTYKMVDKLNGTPVTFVLNGTAIKEGTNSESPVSTKTVYRINLDFNKSTATLTEIMSVGLWVSGFGRITATLNYDAAGVWKANGIVITWKQESWGLDERYKFRMIEKDASGTLFTRNMGSSKIDNQRANSGTSADYYFLNDVSNNDYDWTYKFAQQSNNADVEFRLSATDANYTHKIIYK